MTVERSAIERVAREATGRLVALLARRSGDLALAEDAMASALVAALEQWPSAGAPQDPEGWLYTVARRKLVGQWRRAAVRQRKAAALQHFHLLQAEPRDNAGWADERLPLLFVCAHPAIAEHLRAPLMLQAVLGMTADDLGPLLGVAPKTIGQRLWRTKVKIKSARIPFIVPDAPELPERLAAVLDAIYGLYGVGWSQTGRGALAGEAVWLAEVLCGLLPDQPESLGLYALLQYAEARRAAGRTHDGLYIPLDAQDPSRWDQQALAVADETLQRAHAGGVIGPFQLEAAIQSALVTGRLTGRTDHVAIGALYDGLVALAPTLGVQVGRAAALAEHHGPEQGLLALDGIYDAAHFQPWWAVRAALLQRLGQTQQADEAYTQAISLTTDPTIRAFLHDRQRQLHRGRCPGGAPDLHAGASPSA